MKRLISAITAIVLFGAGLAAHAADSAAGTSTREPDTRITQKVTYEAKSKSVKIILADLSKMTGVTLRAGNSDSDWQVRDRKMNIFAKDIPLSNLINAIAHVMKFTWSKTKDEIPTYRLYMDRTALSNAETQRLREEERRNRQEVERRQKTLAGLDELGDLTQDELAKLKQENPFLYLTATTGIAKSLSEFFKGSPAAMEAFASGQEMTLSSSDLPLTAQQALAGALRGFSKFSPAVVAGLSGTDFPSDLEASVAQAVIRINPNMDQVRSQPLASELVIGTMGIKLKSDGREIGIPFLNPDSPIADWLARAAVRSQDEKRPLGDVIDDMQNEVVTTLMSAVRKDESGEPISQHSADDPALHRKIKSKAMKPGRLTDVLAALADASRLPVVSDSYGASTGFVTVAVGETELGALLDKIADGFHYNWDKPHGILEFRDRNWFTKRAAQIPDAWIDGWKKTLRETGTLDISDLKQIAMLTMEQCNVNLQGDEELSRCGIPSCLYSYRDLLRACATLKDSQWKAMYTDSGLDMNSLNDEQRQVFEKLINSRNSNLLKNEDVKLTLCATRKSYEKQFDYSFGLKSSDETNPITWRVFTPNYVEPPKEEKTPDKTEGSKP
jgi:hypothetical protein